MALCRTPRRIARPARPEHGFEGPRGLLRRPARHSGDRPSGGRNLDPAAALLPAARLRRESARVHPPFVPPPLRAAQAGADELSFAADRRRGPPLRRFRPRDGAALHRARGPAAFPGFRRRNRTSPATATACGPNLFPPQRHGKRAEPPEVPPASHFRTGTGPKTCRPAPSSRNTLPQPARRRAAPPARRVSPRPDGTCRCSSPSPAPSWPSSAGTYRGTRRRR